MPDILTAPLTAVGGAVSLHGKVTVHMHGSFDRPLLSPAEIAATALGRTDLERGAPCLVHGDLANPYFSWPIYAVRG